MCLFDSPASEALYLSYRLPRIELRSDEDCSSSIYHTEFIRALNIIKSMGANTVHLLCPWTNPLMDRTKLPPAMVDRNLSFILSFRTDIHQIKERGGEKEFRMACKYMQMNWLRTTRKRTSFRAYLSDTI